MNVVVIGMGEVGAYITEFLAKERHEVLAIDNDGDRIARSASGWMSPHSRATAPARGAPPGRGGEGRPRRLRNQQRRGEHHRRAGIKRLGAGRAVARLQSGEYEDAEPGEVEEGLQFGMFGIDMVVNSHILVADEMFDIARSHGALDVHMFANNKVDSRVQLPEDSAVLGIPLNRMKLTRHTRVAAVIRGRATLCAQRRYDAAGRGGSTCSE